MVEDLAKYRNGKKYVFGTMGDQVFSCVGLIPHVRRDGTKTALAVVEAACADCGALFLQTQPTTGREVRASRRCGKHAKPGKRVTK